MSDPILNLEHALPIRHGELGYAMHVHVFSVGWQPISKWRETYREADADRNEFLSAVDASEIH